MVGYRPGVREETIFIGMIARFSGGNHSRSFVDGFFFNYAIRIKESRFVFTGLEDKFKITIWSIFSWSDDQEIVGRLVILVNWRVFNLVSWCIIENNLEG